MTAANGKYFEDSMFWTEQILGRLAMKFRSTPDEQRSQIAGEYESAVQELIDTGQWNDVPAPEDQLPPEFMPKNFFAYWDERALRKARR
jgi:hypothetical protein